MIDEAWNLAAALLTADGLAVPALLLWNDADDLVKLERVLKQRPDSDLVEDVIAAAGDFRFDHAIMISRTVIGLASSCPDAESSSRQGVALSRVSRAGERGLQFGSIVDCDGVLQLAAPAKLPLPGNALDMLFRSASQAAVH